MSRSRDYLRLGLVVVLAALPLLLFGPATGTANAAPWNPDCQAGPGEAQIARHTAMNPMVGAPVKPGAQPGKLQDYGTAGYYWPTQKLKCTSIGNVLGNFIGNIELDAAKFILNADNELLTMTPALTAFDEQLAGAITRNGKAIQDYWPVAGVLLAIWVALSRSGHRIMSGIVIALACASVTVVLTDQPAKVLATADHVSTSAQGMATSAMLGDTATDPANALTDAVLGTVWTTGMFNDANSEAAQRFGERQYANQAIGMHEQAGRSGEQMKALRASKGEDWTAAYDEVGRIDPAAQDMMAGKQGLERAMLGLAAIIFAVVLTPFVFLLAGGVFVASAGLRVLAIAGPAALWCGIPPRTRQVTETWAGLLLIAVFAGFFLSLGLGLFLIIAIAALSQVTDMLAQIFLTVLFGTAILIFGKPLLLSLLHRNTGPLRTRLDTVTHFGRDTKERTRETITGAAAMGAGAAPAMASGQTREPPARTDVASSRSTLTEPVQTQREPWEDGSGQRVGSHAATEDWGPAYRAANAHQESENPSTSDATVPAPVPLTTPEPAEVLVTVGDSQGTTTVPTTPGNVTEVSATVDTPATVDASGTTTTEPSYTVADDSPEPLEAQVREWVYRTRERVKPDPEFADLDRELGDAHADDR